MDLNNFFAMGGYAIYVWPAYAITALVMLLTWWFARRRRAAGLARARRRAAQDLS